MKVQPLHNYILVKLTKPNTESEGGLIIPEYAKEKPREGIVIEQGDLVKKSLNTMKVLIKKWGGTEIEIDGEEHLLIQDIDILAIINDD